MTAEELMKEVRRVEVTARHAVTEVFAGEYSSAFKGRGIEFAEVREYQPGDDVRSIDWNVTARAGRPFVKRYIEERELTVVLAVDLSGSEDFGTGEMTKHELAARLAALIAFSAMKNNDRVALLVYTDKVELFIPPGKGTRHALRCVREILAFERPSGGTDILAAADRLARVLKRRSVVILISDFASSLPTEHAEARLERALGLLRRGFRGRGHDVIALDLADVRELELPRAGLIELEDAETGRRRMIDASSRRVRRAFSEGARRRRDARATIMARMGVDRADLLAGHDYVDQLARLFRRREMRRSR